MNNVFISFFDGLGCTLCLFLLCFFIVVGVKAVYIKLKLAFTPPTLSDKNVVKRHKKHATPPKQVQKPVRSIEINPDEIDRIYVKKIS